MVDFPNLDSVHQQSSMLAAPTAAPSQRGQLTRTPTQNLMRTIGTFTGGGFFFIFVLILADLVLVPWLKPSQVWGAFMGNVSRAQIEASGPATVKLQQQLAQVQAQEQAKAQAAAQQQTARIQNQLDTTREAYGSLYRRSEALVGTFLQVQSTAQQYRSQAAANGNIGATYVNGWTSFMCSISRANDDHDKDGWCGSNDRVRQGQAQDLDSVVVSRQQLEQQLYGGLPDPPVQRIEDTAAQQAAIAANPLPSR